MNFLACAFDRVLPFLLRGLDTRIREQAYTEALGKQAGKIPAPDRLRHCHCGSDSREFRSQVLRRRHD